MFDPTLAPGLPLRRCGGCALPHAACPCAELPRLSTRTRVVVLMHREEATKTTNSARLAASLLASARIVVSGARDPRERDPLPPGAPLVLFPSPSAPVLDASFARGEAPVLVVPDGTWSQARRMMQRTVVDRGATIVRLPDGPASRYRLRRGVRPDGVSTFEAIARALAVLEDPGIEAAMMPWFDRFVATTLRLRGSA